MARLGHAAGAVLLVLAAAQASEDGKRTLHVGDTSGLELHRVKADLVTHAGRPALRLVETGGQGEGHALAILAGSQFRDGVIEADLAGAPRQGAAEGARGFVGIAFRVQDTGSRFECFYLRPTNGRAPDQLRRNHATQYISHPDYPWQRLRQENPGVYESYVDLVPSAWTRVRIVVEGTRASLFVHGADQPALIVNDLKLGEGSGRIALWIGQGTEAWFSDVSLSPRSEPLPGTP